MINDKTHICYIELNGNVITRTIDGELVIPFTGNLTILHKILKYVSFDAREKAKIKSLDPDLYLGSIEYIFRNPTTGEQIVSNSTFIRKFVQFINKPTVIEFDKTNSIISEK